MKRYFDLKDKKLTAELEIKNNSPAATASVEEIMKAMKWSGNVEEVNKARYKMLSEQYSS